MSDSIVLEDGVADASLYVRIGGQAAVEAAVDSFYERILADRDLASYFVGVNLRQLKAHQRAFITMALGGPAYYQGRPLGDAHRRLGITDEAFAKVVAHLADTLVALGVDPADIAAIADALAPMQPQVVSPPS